MKKLGALARHTIQKMIRARHIRGARAENAQPASLDLTLTNELYRVQSVFLPQPGERVKNAMAAVAPERHNMKIPLEVGVTYLARLAESLALPKDVYAYANPKSSLGRIDVHVRMLADAITRFDSAGVRGYQGELWALITPGSFRVKVNPGDSLLQLRFLNHDTRFGTERELKAVHEKTPLVFTGGKAVAYDDFAVNDRDGTLTLTVNLDLTIAGYRAERSQNVLDLSKRALYDADDFFQKIPRPKNGAVTLRKGDFYILATKEALRVPPAYAAEVKPIDVRTGEYRAHYAGFFDPGWGYGPKGDIPGAPAVLEVRAFEDNIIIRSGQPICKIVFERMAEIPKHVYGATGSHYLDQKGIKLSKHFRKTA
ncbi:MAG: hypothetical protein A2847_02890 [Candidatus Sungbacteria bacterium RIFCSPHIGHO2_01_FULL_50_25]|uniref:2'-deoxycytidine 5'-triphosphate deaminase n=1 Tax=Candidatus Sungbacteria bacterium RIFCSPHIGHO2_01_FULL_50_25 TaxID=1802265 RepID=A0A1G2KCR9_9BACT|nr:MAG: hypothetical protein A2847_02890 [Candidatus Sungbacteria bacterium RIFCSPHIGHO2_01_FULL_50_25]